jgi:translation initiation factor 3 subunit M
MMSTTAGLMTMVCSLNPLIFWCPSYNFIQILTGKSIGINHPTAFRKIRLLTLASLASSAPNRELPYSVIARRLHIPSEEVELWVIDVIRAGLVEGKLSQLNQTFLIHRSTYRSFGKQEWEEIGIRLETWKLSLRGILETVRSARESVAEQHGKESAAVESAVGRINGGRSLEVEG